MLRIRLFWRSEYTKYYHFEIAIAYFGSLSELHEYIHSFVWVFAKHYCHLYKISSFPLNGIWYFCVHKRKTWYCKVYQPNIYCIEIASQPAWRSGKSLDFQSVGHYMKALVRAPLVAGKYIFLVQNGNFRFCSWMMSSFW